MVLRQPREHVLRPLPDEVPAQVGVRDDRELLPAAGTLHLLCLLCAPRSKLPRLHGARTQPLYPGRHDLTGRPAQSYTAFGMTATARNGVSLHVCPPFLRRYGILAVLSNGNIACCRLPVTRLSRALLKRFGVIRLRPGQREVIESVLSGRDT